MAIVGPATSRVIGPPVGEESQGAVAPGPAVGDGLLLEAGTDFLLLESGDYLILE